MVEADVGMMEQVLLNLAVNARDAMPKGGRLAVRISIVEVNEAHVQHHPEARVGRFRLCQQDGHRQRHSAGKSSAHL
jgi:two-component system cell cycle sensor histidine kinase/response regulator CckA